MADHDPVPEADALEQARPANDADPELIGVDDDPETDFEGSEADAVEQGAAEGEPGTFKDRRLMRDNPYQLIEGVAIAAFAIGAREAFIGLKASFATENDRLTRALADMTAAGLAGDVPIRLVPGPEEYLLG